MIKKWLYKLGGINSSNTKIIKKQEEEKYNQDLCDDAITSFKFIIDKEGRLFIEGSWIESSEEMAEIIAKFLFMLNNGDVRPFIFNYFVGIKEKLPDIRHKNFIDIVLLKWGEMSLKKEDIEDEPIVQPSRAFVFNQIKQTSTESEEDEDEE
jgi:hypothetical protein